MSIDKNAYHPPLLPIRVSALRLPLELLQLSHCLVNKSDFCSFHTDLSPFCTAIIESIQRRKHERLPKYQSILYRITALCIAGDSPRFPFCY